MSPTSPDWARELQEALWESAQEFGVALAVSQQVAISRVVAVRPIEEVTPADIQSAFADVGLARPSRAYAKAALAAVKGVVPKEKKT